MGRIRVLDCTLRDGGYCNQWRFGKKNIHKVIGGLVEAGIDIIECGFLTNRIEYDQDVTKYTRLEEISAVLPEDRAGRIFVCMVNYGEYCLEDIPEHDGSSVDGFRIAFHKKDMLPALELCRGLKEKGYLVFIQAMVSLNYSDEEFLDLIRRVNAFQPYAFYIVDSFGEMKRNDLVRMFYLVEHNLHSGIAIGYHSHNNMQLAYSNAQALLDIRMGRDMIIDSSVYGMGRGAGNLNTELFVEYLNETEGTAYQLKPLLGIMDEVLAGFYQEEPWGYSLPNYLSAAHHAHPNYSGYLSEKHTLTVADMDEIFRMMDPGKKNGFDREYIRKLYTDYQSGARRKDTAGGPAGPSVPGDSAMAGLREHLRGKTVLLIAPGKSSADEREAVVRCAARWDVVTVSVNFDYPYCETDYIFVSNLRRFRALEPGTHKRCIVTSNIAASNETASDVSVVVPYSPLLNRVECVKDNAGLMAVKLLAGLGVERILLAGLDGYSHDMEMNYAESGFTYRARNEALDAMNEGMQKVLEEYAGLVRIGFLTGQRHIRLGDPGEADRR